MLAICNLLPQLVVLQIVAFFLLFHLPARYYVKASSLVIMGLYFGLGYTIPQLIYLRLPAIMTALLVVDLVAMSIALTWSAGRVIGRGGILGAVGAAACVTLLDWANYTLIPLWGTAQSFARNWSTYPAIILFESFTGMPGTVFTVAAVAALAAVLAAQPKSRRVAVAALAFILFVVVVTDVYVGTRRPETRLTVAAVGWPWTSDSITPDRPDGFETLYAKPVAEAASKGARLIVTPEAGLSVVKNTQQQTLDILSALATHNGVWLVAGYIDGESEENRLVVFAPDGSVELTYVKTHIIPGMETWQRGTGAIAATRMNDVWLGAMICQDDNFTDISRGHSREETQIMAIPTLDWQRVSAAHLCNSLHRPIESGYAIVRAAINGVSAIADAHGIVLASKDHTAEGPGYIVAEVPICEGGTFYGIAGNWVVAASALFLAVRLAVIRFQRIKLASSVLTTE